MQNSDLSQPQFDEVLRKVLDKIQPDYKVKIVEDPQRFLNPGEVSYSISGNYRINLMYAPDLETRREETVNVGDLETAIREKFDEMGIPKTNTMNNEKHILNEILETVAKKGEYSVDSDVIVNTLYHRSETIKSEASLEQWAKDNNLKVGSTFVGNGKTQQRQYVFSRQR